MIKKLVIIDGNNLYSRAFFVARSKSGTIVSKIPDNLNDILVSMVANLVEMYRGARIVFTFDTTKSSRRLELLVDYKGKRKSSLSEEEYSIFKTQLDIFIKMTKFSGFIAMFGRGYEADDYIACLTAMTKMRYDVTIVSTDGDLYQLIDERVRVYDPLKGLHVTHENFHNIFQLSLSLYLDYKIMVGDVSDNVKGIDQVADKRAKGLLEEYGNIDKIWKALQEKQTYTVVEKKFMEAMKSGLIDRNYKLLDLKIPQQDPILRAHVKEQSTSEQDLDKLSKLFMLNHQGHNYKVWLEKCLKK